MASKKIYIDSSILYAFVDRADPHHGQSAKIIEQLSLQGVHLYTSFQSIQDTSAAINHQLGVEVSFDFLQAMLESDIEILYPQKTDLISSFKLAKANRNNQVTLKEALIATLMQKRGIMQILIFTYWHNLLGTQSYLTKFN